MRLLPRSLRGRLLATALVAMAGALAFAAFAIGHVLERYVIRGVDERLDAQIALLGGAVTPAGDIDRDLLARVDRAIAVEPGWSWSIEAPRGRVRRGASAIVQERGGRDHRRDAHLPPPDSAPALPPAGNTAPPPPDERAAALRPVEGERADGTEVHGRRRTYTTLAGPVTITAIAPRALVDRPLRAAMVPLLGSLALLAGALGLAIIVQLRLGLRPLDRIATMLVEVRDGRRRHVAIDEPTELLPLVAELNALIDANAASLDKARGHVANLAHGVKTPLAALRLDLAASGADAALIDHVDRIDAQVRHHLGRARAASIDSGATVLLPAVEALANALARIHADRGVAASLSIPADLAVRCDAQDLDEMLGNILDNAWRAAASRIAVTATRTGRAIAIHIADDGPGIPTADLDRLHRRGERLDQRGDGFGFGIPIARELAELHGGGVSFAAASGGGLAVTITLPAAATDPGLRAT